MVVKIQSTFMSDTAMYKWFVVRRHIPFAYSGPPSKTLVGQDTLIGNALTTTRSHG